jgi:hypothetical protein
MTTTLFGSAAAVSSTDPFVNPHNIEITKPVAFIGVGLPGKPEGVPESTVKLLLRQAKLVMPRDSGSVKVCEALGVKSYRDSRHRVFHSEPSPTESQAQENHHLLQRPLHSALERARVQSSRLLLVRE